MTLKLGWCLSNQHAGDPKIPAYQQCPGEVWSHICPCECHVKHPPQDYILPLNPPDAERPKAKPKTEPKPIPAPAKKPVRQRRKLL